MGNADPWQWGRPRLQACASQARKQWPDEGPFSYRFHQKIKALPDAIPGTNNALQSLNCMTRQTTRFDETQPVVGGVGDDTGIGLSHSMFAFSLHSRVTQQL
jgi:hypothetical protein